MPREGVARGGVDGMLTGRETTVILLGDDGRVRTTGTAETGSEETGSEETGSEEPGRMEPTRLDEGDPGVRGRLEDTGVLGELKGTILTGEPGVRGKLELGVLGRLRGFILEGEVFLSFGTGVLGKLREAGVLGELKGTRVKDFSVGLIERGKLRMEDFSVGVIG